MNDLFGSELCSAFQRAFPDDEDTPFGIAKRRDMFCIVLMVGPDLLLPECLPGFWPLEEMEVVPVPGAAVYKYDRVEATQNKIRLARKILDVKPESKPRRMQTAADLEFRLRVFAPDTGHHPAAGLG